LPEDLFVPLGDVEATSPGDPFPSPFDEGEPSPLASLAAAQLREELRRGELLDEATRRSLAEHAGGKMFGVLVVRSSGGTLGYLRAFSGTLGGRFDVPGFVSPVFDRAARAAVEVPGESVVKRLTERAASSGRQAEAEETRRTLEAMRDLQARERTALRLVHAERRAQRRRSRSAITAASGEASDAAVARAELHALDQESRGDKAERREQDRRHAVEIGDLEKRASTTARRAAAETRLHGIVSRALMRRIHDTYLLTNARGETRAMRALFAPDEPPGGAGDCAGVKLLVHAIASGLAPLALAEFWIGAPPAGGGRYDGAFYPACREKCGPILPFLLEGIAVAKPRRPSNATSSSLELRVVFEDDAIVVVEKPAGLLSVPGKGDAGSDSVQARLCARLRSANRALMLVHRLDLDASGLLIAAKTPDAYRSLQRQFLERRVRKTYVAVLDGCLAAKGSGRIVLPMRPDPSERPRQVVDPERGKAACTEWSVLEAGPRTTRVLLVPVTGRTHQLRVHCAHPDGLGVPIVGDRLYGIVGERLMLHATAVEIEHPVSRKRHIFESKPPF
jgi:tRNA pseudouridine32 synthase/23S rRNA pseudouridine746 synthase